MAVTDWRAWTAQNGGSQPGQTSPYAFTGVGPISDLISGSTSIPNYANVPITINAVDPFAGWTDQKETLSKTMRPAIPGMTSP